MAERESPLNLIYSLSRAWTRESDLSAHPGAERVRTPNPNPHRKVQKATLEYTNRTPARASPPPSATAAPSARQQAAPVMLPSSWNWMAFMPPATVGMICSVWPRVAQALADAFGNAVLDLEHDALGPDARRLDRLLQRHAVVDQVDQRLPGRGEDLAAARQAERIDAPGRRAAPSSATSRW